MGVEDALAYKENERRLGKTAPDFKCVHCHEAVRPHRDGGHTAAHFEHLSRNPACPLSDPERT